MLSVTFSHNKTASIVLVRLLHNTKMPFSVILLLAMLSASFADITFQLPGIPDTWVGFPAGMVQPRDSATHVVPVQFNGAASNFTYSIISDQTTSSYGRITVPLSKFDRWELDMYVSHANGMWPCVDANGNGIQNLELPSCKSDSSYLVRAGGICAQHPVHSSRVQSSPVESSRLLYL